MSTPTKMFAIVSDAICQGLTASSGDFYATEAEANKELEDIRKMREGRMADEDDAVDEDLGYMVIPVTVHEEGLVVDEAGQEITVTSSDGDTEYPVELTKMVVVHVRADTPLMAKVVARSADQGGEYSDLWRSAEVLRSQSLDEQSSQAQSGTPLNDLQRKILSSYAGGDYAHFQYVEEADDCGDTLVKFLLTEAHDAHGDTHEFCQMMETAIRQLDALQQDIETASITQRQAQ